jgi:hypothetical protein
MKGRARAAKQSTDRDVFLAWHIAVFGVRAYIGKLGDLDKYIKSDSPKPPKTPDQMLADLQALQAMGVPMNIKKLH